MAKTKLSPTQRKVLERLAAGGLLVAKSPAHYMLGDMRVQGNTVRSMDRKRLLRDCWGYDISPAGRKALEDG